MKLARAMSYAPESRTTRLFSLVSGDPPPPQFHNLRNLAVCLSSVSLVGRVEGIFIGLDVPPQSVYPAELG